MKIYTSDGPIPFKQFTFPDGQPHFELQIEGHLKDGDPVTIETAIRNPAELFDVVLAGDALRRAGYYPGLDIRYLMGARMDRAINNRSPFTLKVVAEVMHEDLLFRPIRILDPHSEVALKLLNATAVYPTTALAEALAYYTPEETTIVVPDRGALARSYNVPPSHRKCKVIQGMKLRDMATGKLSAFAIDYPDRAKNQTCFIIDDICDGGGTFAGLGEILLKAGAKRVDLFVTHGIFSKGLPIPNIQAVYTTNSFSDSNEYWQVTKFQVDMSRM